MRSYQWLQNAGLKAETGGFISAAQDQSHFTWNYQTNVTYNEVGTMNLYIRNEKLESASCSVLTPIEYKTRQDQVSRHLHWRICHHYDNLHPKNWYKYYREPVTEGENATILWNYGIHTYQQINDKRPNSIIKDLRQKKYVHSLIRQCLLRETTRQRNFKNYRNIKKLRLRYQDLAIKNQNILVVVGTFRMIEKDSDKRFNQFPGKPTIFET